MAIEISHTALGVSIGVMAALVASYIPYILRTLTIQKKHQERVNEPPSNMHVSMPDGTCYFYSVRIESVQDQTLTLDTTVPSTSAFLADLRRGIINRAIFSNSICHVSAKANTAVVTIVNESTATPVAPLNTTYTTPSISAETTYHVPAWKG